MCTGIDIFGPSILHPEGEARYDLRSTPVVHMATLQLVGIARYSSLVAPCLRRTGCASAAKRMDARERPPNVSHYAGRSTAVSRIMNQRDSTWSVFIKRSSKKQAARFGAACFYCKHCKADRLEQPGLRASAVHGLLFAELGFF